MGKLILVAAPTFPCTVSIPVAGGPPGEVVFTFKHRDAPALQAYMAELKAMGPDSIDNDVAIILKVATGWDLPEPFDETHVRILVHNYHRAPFAIANAYIEELMQAKAGN